MLARLLVSCTGIEFGAGPKQLEKYDRLSYDAEMRGGGRRGGSAVVDPASEWGEERRRSLGDPQGADVYD
jgi:hypothetical protein